MKALLRMLIASLMVLTLSLLPVFGEEGGESGIINLPANAVMSAQWSYAMSSPQRPPLLNVTQGVTRPIHLQLPAIMRPAVVWITDPEGGEILVPCPTGSFSVSSATLHSLINSGCRSLSLRFVAPGGLFISTQLTLNRSTRTATVTVF